MIYSLAQYSENLRPMELCSKHLAIQHCESYWSVICAVDNCDILINNWQIIELIGQLSSLSIQQLTHI